MQRREFLIIAGATGSAGWLGLAWPCAGAAVAAADPWQANAWLSIQPDGSAVIQVHKSEMGQGVMTALPMLIAEELSLPMSRIRAELAPAHTKFRDARGNQTTGYSSSVSGSYQAFRSLGATARALLLAAAAERWNVPVARLEIRDGVVADRLSAERRAHYGELASLARSLPVPAAVELKARQDFELIGTRQPRVDTPPKIDGSAAFGVDVRLPGLRTALVARCPVLGGKPRRIDARRALRIAGVERVLEISSGVAVVARDFWSAQRGREALRITWDTSAVALRDSAEHERMLRGPLERPGRNGRRAGEPERIEQQTDGRWVRADYQTPFLAHAAMEPLAATAHVQNDRCDVWLGTQAPSRAQNWAASITGLPLDQVFVHSMFLGGAFGRRGEWDFVVEAVETAKAFGAPVKVMWTREDDMQHDFYRPATANRLSARLDDSGAPQLLTHRMASPSIARRRSPEMLQSGSDFLMTQGSSDLRYAIPHLRIDYHEVDLGIPVGFWRSVGHSSTGFVLESFIDEIAHAAAADPLAYRLTMLRDEPRLHAVVERAGREADWSRPRGPNRGRGIACMESYGTFVAQVADVRIDGRSVIVERVVCVVDCGVAVNPGIVEQQMHSGIVYALSAALAGEISFERGAVRQSNYHDYPALRMHEMPQIEVHIIASNAPPGGCGEPAAPLIAPAVCNAVFDACGQRVRRLPIRLA